MVSGFQSLLGLSIAVKVSFHTGPVLHKVLFVFHSIVVVVSGPVCIGFIASDRLCGQLGFSLVDVGASGFFPIQTASVVNHLNQPELDAELLHRKENKHYEKSKPKKSPIGLSAHPVL